MFEDARPTPTRQSQTVAEASNDNSVETLSAENVLGSNMEHDSDAANATAFSR